MDSKDKLSKNILSKGKVDARLKEERLKAIELLEKSGLDSTLSPSFRDFDLTSERSYPKNTLNVSELYEDKTIYLRSPSSSIRKNGKISFEPNEITGRSTMQRSSIDSNKMTIDEILATSCSEEVRRLRDSISSSSRISNFSNLPRTANVSFVSDEFTPAEKMESKLLSDELSWAREYADIPILMVGKDSDAKSEDSLFPGSKSNNSYLESNPNFSLGKYFVTRSEELENIVTSKNHPKNDEYSMGLIDGHDSEFSIVEENQAYKDSGNSSDCSYSLSMSAIQKALRQIQCEDSDSVFTERFLNAKAGKNTKCQQGGALKNKQDIMIVPNNDDILENKENVDPKSFQNNSDTLSFSDSLLNSTSMRSNERNSRSPRQPLSPIEVTKPPLENSEDADVDELPSTPVKSPLRKVRYIKNANEAKPVNQAEKHTKYLALPHLDSATDNADCEDNNETLSLKRCNKRRAVNVRSCSSSPLGNVSSQLSSPNRTNEDDRSLSPFENRQYLVGRALAPISSPSPVDHGKFSLPAYGIVQRTISAVSLKSHTSSRCSSSSEFNHHDGKAIPLKVTCLELSWGSTRLRKNVCKTMQIKNTSNKRLVLRVSVAGPGFQIVNGQGNVTLQPQECRSISISFYPTVTGAAAGVLSFSSPSIENQSIFLEIPLYGYGGHAGIIPQNIIQGPVGSAFLPLGELREISQQPIEKTIRIYNRGVLNGFAVLMIDTMGLDLPRVSDFIEIVPKQSHIPANGAVNFRIIFTPRRDDIKKIAKKITSVFTLANLRIIVGDEPNRQRIFKLYKQLDDKEKFRTGLKTLDQVWFGFAKVVPVADLQLIKEKPETALDLITGMRIHEVAITINNDVHNESSDTTLSTFADADETVLFRSICRSPSPQLLDTIEENCDEEKQKYNPLTASGRFWSVTPKVIEFDLENYSLNQSGAIASITIQNFFPSSQYFEVISDDTEMLRFIPCKGSIDGKGGNCTVEIFLMKGHLELEKQTIIWVYLGNQRITVFLNSAHSNCEKTPQKDT